MICSPATFTQPVAARRQGKTSAWTSPPSITLS